MLGPEHAPTIMGGAQKDSSDFQAQLVASQQAQQGQEWDRLIEVVSRLGDRLVQHPSVDAAQAYRDAVMELVQRAVYGGLAVQQLSAQGHMGKQKIFMQIQQIDQYFVGMMHQVMHHQQEPMDLLKIVGEIKGLLISLHL